jgi:hypothetical protein
MRKFLDWFGGRKEFNTFIGVLILTALRVFTKLDGMWTVVGLVFLLTGYNLSNAMAKRSGHEKVRKVAVKK